MIEVEKEESYRLILGRVLRDYDYMKDELNEFRRQKMTSEALAERRCKDVEETHGSLLSEEQAIRARLVAKMQEVVETKSPRSGKLFSAGWFRAMGEMEDILLTLPRGHLRRE